MFQKPRFGQLLRAAVLCPQCRLPMIDMGVYFEPPPLRDRALWFLMSALAEKGYRFHSEGDRALLFGGGKPGVRGPSKRAVALRIKNMPAHKWSCG